MQHPLVLYLIKVLGLNRKTGIGPTTTISKGEINEKVKPVLSGLLHPLQALDLDDVGTTAFLTRGGLEEPACEGLVQC